MSFLYLLSMPFGLKILNQDYFNDYKTQLKVDVESALARLKNPPLTRVFNLPFQHTNKLEISLLMVDFKDYIFGNAIIKGVKGGSKCIVSIGSNSLINNP